MDSSWVYVEPESPVLGDRSILDMLAHTLPESPAEPSDSTTPTTKEVDVTSRAVHRFFTDASERKETTNADPFETTPRYRDIAEDRPRYAKDPKYQDLPWPAMVNARRTTQQELSRTSEVTSVVAEIKQSAHEPHAPTTNEGTYETYTATENLLDDKV